MGIRISLTSFSCLPKRLQRTCTPNFTASQRWKQLRPCTSFLLPPHQLEMIPSGHEPETLWLLAMRSDQLSYETSCWPLQLLGQGFRLPSLFTHLKSAHHSQSAQVIKGVDLRSTAGNCAWFQTPWLTLSRVQASCLTPSTLDNSGGKTCSPTPSQLKQNSATGTRTRVARMRAEYPDQPDYSHMYTRFRGRVR